MNLDLDIQSIGNEEVLFCWNGLDVYFEKIGIQKVIDGKKYYGWIHRYGSEELHFPFKKWVYIDKMAFCTIPDYPLRWGQTEIEVPAPIVPDLYTIGYKDNTSTTRTAKLYKNNALLHSISATDKQVTPYKIASDNDGIL